ncbi:VOC family protein [Burkholderia glumae]|uniref:VOC family protein n=1 Tax=Burkholderia glumae TaxID=337 RepID=A0AAP9Y140_BURGL|nr:VOC family protein [Burkholderia glumae]ACR27394.1 3-demethylubiquinone-9 3-methyltransferase [Burkholderia glumae BGR1]AJY66280.1 3-demethylubiquinone-9 3-methyltransferase family protein [Burkholderia glumae LMG 2196 = ATCC 33617]KHJ62397.1 3-demethylubiquinone-9 3-methyltransferase [Burkholderia glumae]MCM2481647.1 VOC family protein [Burkholderia glumae]MCM2508213.1 VOC family protein [Burkholderia glumae]
MHQTTATALPSIQRITPFLWFDHEAEAAANFYVSVFDDSRITRIARYGREGARAAGQAEGTVMTVAFELAGQAFSAINGGPVFRITPAVSFVVNCRSQDEIDRYWTSLGDGCDESAQQCGWLKDRFGVSWQVVPVQLPVLLGEADAAQAARVMGALMTMKKLDLAALERAAAGHQT